MLVAVALLALVSAGTALALTTGQAARTVRSVLVATYSRNLRANGVTNFDLKVPMPQCSGTRRIFDCYFGATISPSGAATSVCIDGLMKVTSLTRDRVHLDETRKPTCGSSRAADLKAEANALIISWQHFVMAPVVNAPATALDGPKLYVGSNCRPSSRWYHCGYLSEVDFYDGMHDAWACAGAATVAYDRKSHSMKLSGHSNPYCTDVPDFTDGQ
jgi:hypothetical protein